MEYNIEKKRTPTSPAEKVGARLVTPKLKPVNKPSDKQTPKVYEKKIYTDMDIQTMLDGYINVHPSLWDHLPNGAHMRYFKKGPQARTERFKPGGFIKNRFTNAEGKKFIMVETIPGGKGGAGYIQFPLAYEDINQLWKKYDHGAFIEIHLISTSLAQKKKQIEELTARLTKLEAKIYGSKGVKEP